jgi:DNA-binding NarL/FixJ family response regulator
MTLTSSLLLVEDNPGDAGLVRAWLETSCPGRFHVEHVDRLNVACERAASYPYDAGILDLCLTDSVGVDTVSRFRVDGPNCALVVFTGHDDANIALDAMARGADELLCKGDANPARLTAAIDRAIARHRRCNDAEALADYLRSNVFSLQRALAIHRVGIVVHGDDGTVRFANYAALSLLGVRCGDELPDPLRRSEREWWGQATVTGADGRARPVALLARPIAAADPNERCGAVLVRGTDVDPRPLTPDLADSLLLIGAAEALVSRAADLTQASLPIASHLVAIDLLRLALELKRSLFRASAAAGKS